MKNKTIRGAIFGLILTLGLSTVAFADTMDMGKGTEKSMNGIKAELSFNKDDKVKTGNNDVMITLHDNSDKEIENATVNISAEMDKNSDMGMNMDKSKPIEAALENSEKGQYMGNINFTDKGKWLVTANIMVNGEKQNVQFDVDVASGGPNWIVIGGFIGIVAVIIVVAAVKKKSSK